MRGPGTSAALLVRNTLANGLGGMAGMAIGILLTPIMITQLGLAAYGVWTLALTLTFSGGYAALADLGIEAATARYVAEAEGEDPEGVNRTVSTTLAFFTLLGLVLAGIIVALSGPLTHVFSVSPAMRGDAHVCFALVGAQLAFELPSRAYVAVLEGTQNFINYQAVELTRALLQAGLWIGALAAGWGIGALAAGLMLSTACVLLLYWRLAHRAVPGLRAGPHHASRAEFRRLLRFGGGVFVLRFTGTLYRQMDKVILGIALTPAAVGIYEVANKIHLAASQVQSMSVSALLPATATSRKDPALLRDMFLRGTCYTTAVSMPVVFAVFVFAEPLIRDWIGGDADAAAGPARLFLVYLVLNTVLAVGASMVVALGRLRVLLWATVANVLINLVVSIVLVGPMGIEGVILGTLIGNAVIFPVSLRLYLHTFDVPMAQWLARVVLPNAVPALAQFAALGGLYALVSDQANLALVGLAVVASLIVSFAVFLRVGLPSEERRVLLSTLRSAIRRPAPAAS